MADPRGRRSDAQRRPSRAAAAASAAPAGAASGAPSIAAQEALLGMTLAQAKASLAEEGIDPRAEGAGVKARVEASWGGLHPANARPDSPFLERRPEAAPPDDFGAFWEPLAERARPRPSAGPRGYGAALRWVRVSGPRLAAFGLGADDSVLVDTRRHPEPGDAVLIWTGDGRRAIVRLRERVADRRLDAAPLGPDDVDDLSATRALGVVVQRAPGS